MSSSFRNLAALPFVGTASEAKIFRACVVVYSLALCVFISSTVAYSSMDSLKQERVVTSIEPVAGMDCKMLTPIRLTVDTGLAASKFLASDGNGGTCAGVAFPAQSPASLNFVYNGYFESLAECQRHINLQITSVTAGTSSDGAVFESDSGAESKISLMFPGGLNGCGFTTETLYSFVETHLPNINQRLCSPWESNSPYQCTEMETLSLLSIASQSLAIATSALSLLVFLANRLLVTCGGDSKTESFCITAESSAEAAEETKKTLQFGKLTDFDNTSDVEQDTEAETWKNKDTGALVEKSPHDNL